MDNPYAAPSSNLSGRDSFSQSSGLSPRTLDIMRRTAPWVRLCGILLLATGGIALIEMVNAEMRGFGSGLLQVFLNVYLGATLMAYSSRIKIMLSSVKVSDLESALDSHRTYWKVNGIFIAFVTIIAAIGLMALVGATAGSR